MKHYEEYFTEKAIIRYLCQERMAYCRDAHEKKFFDEEPKKDSRILELMPPRSRWKRSRKDKRDQINSHRQNLKDLIFTVKHLREVSAVQDHSWIMAQDELIEFVRISALKNNSISFTQPTIIPIPKDRTKKKYRVIAKYDLMDSILIGQCAKYLRQIFDEYFLPCSFAFRLPSNTKPATHHDAFWKIAAFWQNNKKSNKENNQIKAYVAECDIQGFFDTIFHRTILDCYEMAVSEFEELGVKIDGRAKKFIHAYLKSYNYKHGRSLALSQIENATPPMVEDREKTLQRFLSPHQNTEYGVPQGGALSVFFANLILHKVDVAVMNILGKRNDVIYVRYCDDMVIATLDRDATERALEVYIHELKKLKLVHHDPDTKPVEEYSGEEKSRFWQMKTKSTYLWGNSNQANKESAMPWLAFVGYQLRYDGMVRVRPSSIQKELAKQKRIMHRFKASIKEKLENGKITRSKYELLASLEWRLRAGAIGRRHEWDFQAGLEKSEFGWCAGFRMLESNKLPRPQLIAQSQLRQLDRGLSKQLAIFRDFLAKYPIENDSRQNKLNKHRLKFSGKPFSYAGQLKIQEK